MTTTKRTHEPIRSRKASNIPGDTLRRATKPITCEDGTVLPAGTTFRPLCGGWDNTVRGAGAPYSDITVITVPGGGR